MRTTFQRKILKFDRTAESRLDFLTTACLKMVGTDPELRQLDEQAETRPVVLKTYLSS